MNFLLTKSHESRRRVCDFLMHLRDDVSYRVVVEENKPGRSHEQNARYWAILTEIAEQVRPEGRQYSPETWHEWAKANFLGKNTIIIDGVPTLIARSTTKLKVKEFSDYCTQIEAWATEHGVRLYEAF